MKKKYLNIAAFMMLGGLVFTTSCNEDTSEEEVNEHLETENTKNSRNKIRRWNRRK